MDKTKLLLPITILLASVILGGFFYASQVNKQRSIESQQASKLMEDRRTEEAKAEQAKKEYIAERKSECYNLYEKERGKWNNAEGSEYNEKKNVCVIRYKAADEWKGKNCNDYLPKSDATNFSEGGLSERVQEALLETYLDCTSNTFTKSW